MIASLPMYDRAETALAHDRFWALIRDALRDNGIAAPDGLTRPDDLWQVWHSPDLVLAQTCGLPFRARMSGKVTLIGTADYRVEGCAQGYYRSVLVVRADDPRDTLSAFDGARLAYNDALSQSGWAAPAALWQAKGMRMAAIGPTGAHRTSAQAVCAGRADIAAIDAVTWRIMARWDGFASTLRVVGQTPPTPGLPYIAAAGADAVMTRHAVHMALAALGADDRDILGIAGMVEIPAADYLALPLPPAPA